MDKAVMSELAHDSGDLPDAAWRVVIITTEWVQAVTQSVQR